MSPFEPVVAQLFPAIATESVNTMSCGHIIPAENALTTIVSEGPTGKRLELTYERRSDARMVRWRKVRLYKVRYKCPC